MKILEAKSRRMVFIGHQKRGGHGRDETEECGGNVFFAPSAGARSITPDA
jgi:hypothetical protein